MRGLSILGDVAKDTVPTPTATLNSQEPISLPPQQQPQNAGNMSVGLNMSVVVHIFQNSGIQGSKRMMMKTRFVARYDALNSLTSDPTMQAEQTQSFAAKFEFFQVKYFD